jgi:hypothetical protein
MAKRDRYTVAFQDVFRAWEGAIVRVTVELDVPTGTPTPVLNDALARFTSEHRDKLRALAFECGDAMLVTPSAAKPN